jgi:hypothetical protein
MQDTEKSGLLIMRLCILGTFLVAVIYFMCVSVCEICCEFYCLQSQAEAALYMIVSSVCM